MRLKENVRFGNPAVAIATALIIANDVYRELGYDMTVTSFNDSTHSKKSLHYTDQAFDLRTRDVKQSDRAKVTELLKVRLGGNFDVVLESDHIHVEYDPK